MEINQKVNGAKAEVFVKGRIDTSTAPELSDSLKLNNISELIFDLKEVDYVSSAGLRVFLSAHKKMQEKGGKMVVCNVCDTVMEVFEIVGFKDILTIK